MELNGKQLEIMDVAKVLFAQNGFDATSVRDIAQGAQINVAMINYYFSSKENLLDTIVRHGVEDYKLKTENYEHERDPFLRLEKMVEQYVESKFADMHLYQILTSEVTSKKRASYTAIFKELRQHTIQRIKEVIDYGCKLGAFHYYDPMLLHTTMIGTFLNFKTHKTIHNHESDLKNDITKHLKFILKAILTYDITTESRQKK